jgi:ACT domain-containing protein
LAKVAECLAEHEISLATVTQVPDNSKKSASVILTTHQTNEQSIGEAIDSLENLEGVKEKPVLFRMFNPNGFVEK